MNGRTQNTGGYDDGYRSCPCFWGREPGSLMALLRAQRVDWTGVNALDAGCGEGKNAIFLAGIGAKVLAIEVSEIAIRNALATWGNPASVEWRLSDIRGTQFRNEEFEVVVAYGLLHCLDGAQEVKDTVHRLQAATSPTGYNVLCAFNDRRQELSAHPGFTPALLPHAFYLELYQGWEIIFASDENLHETHPHNMLPHVHSLTRILARKRGAA